jgi:hypothetical protein
MPENDVFDDDMDADEQSQNLLGSLHLDADYEPIRRGAASRANSVRFDESALQGANWAGHNGRHSGEFGPTRPTSGMGGHAMMERSLSHKSDGRHSSAGHSVHSMHSGVSGRASSLGLDTNFVIGGGHDEDSPDLDISLPPPGFYYLGSVPSIIRCWLNTNFSQSTLLFAVVCTGSQKSTVDLSLVKELDLTANIRRDADGANRVVLPVYLAEARVTQSNSRSPSPAPQLPSITATFEVTGTDSSERADPKKIIRLFIGSDTLRMHSADLLLSRNLMTLYGNDRDKLSVPFVRPDDDAYFKHLVTTNVIVETPRLNAAAPEFVASEKLPEAASHAVEPDVLQHQPAGEDSHMVQSPTPQRVSPHGNIAAPTVASLNGDDASKQIDVRVPELPSGKEAASTSGDTSTRRDSNTAIWGPWRNGTSANGGDGGKETGPLSGYQPASRSSRSMKVLKPSKSGGLSSSSSSARTGPTYEPPSSSRTSGELRRKSGGAENGTPTTTPSAGTPGVIRWDSKRTVSGSAGTPSTGSAATGGSTKGQVSNEPGAKSSSSTPRSATNPLGSASAFSFLMGKPKASTPAAE